MIAILWHTIAGHFRTTHGLRVALGTVLLHENLSLFSNTFLKSPSLILLTAAALKYKDIVFQLSKVRTTVAQ